MHGIARCLVILGVAGHVALSAADGFATTIYDTTALAGAGDGLLQLAQSTSGNGNGGGNGEGSAGSAPGPGPGPGPGGGHGGDNPAQHFGAAPSVSGACSTQLRLSDASAYANAVEGLAKVSAETEDYLSNCNCPTQACVADALDKYAVELNKVAPRLPRAQRSLPKVVADAARKVRAAPTLPAAVRVVKAAVATVQTVVHKAIALMRAADPDADAAATRGGTLVAHTLGVAAKALERAETL